MSKCPTTRILNNVLHERMDFFSAVKAAAGEEFRRTIALVSFINFLAIGTFFLLGLLFYLGLGAAMIAIALVFLLIGSKAIALSSALPNRKQSDVTRDDLTLTSRAKDIRNLIRN